jgi:mevalonate kinase
MSSTILFETRAQGKLLLTGEYFVLDGATALAMPVRFGQTLRVEAGALAHHIDWNSLDQDGNKWFEAMFELPGLQIRIGSDLKTALTLFKILAACQKLNPEHFAVPQSYRVVTQNDFPREWGLGTSSTLVAALACWASVDPYKILFETLGGSGYDLACAYAEGPILYRLEGQTPTVKPIHFAPEYSDQLYFVFLSKKQNSRDGIARFRESVPKNSVLIEKISRLTQEFLKAKNLEALDTVILEHERLISETLLMPRAKDLYFSDFWGEVKSLGAWGGDFVLVTSARSEAETRAYFTEKGLTTILSWKEMVL